MTIEHCETIAECDRRCCHYYVKSVDDGMMTLHCDHGPPGTGARDCPYYLIFQTGPSD